LLRAAHLADQAFRIVETEAGVAHLALASAAGPPWTVLCNRVVVGRARPDWVDDWLRSCLTQCPRCAGLYREARKWGR
jgi:hypothetical protein